MAIRVVPVRNFKYGTIDSIEDRSIPRGAASRALNWLTLGDKIELRRGHDYIGTEQSGNGKTSGLQKAVDALGTERLFGTYGKKAFYYDRDTTLDWLEIGTDILGNAVVDSNGVAKEEVSIAEYTSPAGNQVWINSPNCAGFFKILVANPTTKLDHYNASYNFKGWLKIDTNRSLLWGRTADKTGLYGSYIDNQTYTTVSGESVGTGDGTTTHFTLTLAAISSTRTVFGLAVAHGANTFTDDYCGHILDSTGAQVGTINYITGALVLDFLTAPANLAAITVSYQWENANSHGISDFTKSATRLAGQGFVFRQDEGGGDLQTIGQYDQVYYCFHIKKTWVLNIGTDDTSATNLPYREKVGIPNPRASVETGDGIYYIDTYDKSKIKVRLLTYDLRGSAKVIPIPVSNNLDLSSFDFSEAASIEWGDFILFACATLDSTTTIDGKTVAVNNRVLVYNKVWKSWDLLDYAVSCFAIYDGALMAGSSLSNNFFTLFSGYSDPNDTDYPNYWEGSLDDLGLANMGKCKGLHVQGAIGPDQKIKVSVSIDGAQFVEVGGSDDGSGNHTYAIEGSGSYVDAGTRVMIGPNVLGRHELGGGSDGVVAYNYERIIPLRLDKFERVKVRVEAVGLGYASVSMADWWDIRVKERNIPRKYRT